MSQIIEIVRPLASFEFLAVCSASLIWDNLLIDNAHTAGSVLFRRRRGRGGGETERLNGSLRESAIAAFRWFVFDPLPTTLDDCNEPLSAFFVDVPSFVFSTSLWPASFVCLISSSSSAPSPSFVFFTLVLLISSSSASSDESEKPGIGHMNCSRLSNASSCSSDMGRPRTVYPWPVFSTSAGSGTRSNFIFAKWRLARWRICTVSNLGKWVLNLFHSLP